MGDIPSNSTVKHLGKLKSPPLLVHSRPNQTKQKWMNHHCIRHIVRCCACHVHHVIRLLDISHFTFTVLLDALRYLCTRMWLLPHLAPTHIQSVLQVGMHHHLGKLKSPPLLVHSRPNQTKQTWMNHCCIRHIVRCCACHVHHVIRLLDVSRSSRC
jgi:hypothetical protein